MSKNSKKTTIFIDGQAGTTGLQIQQHLTTLPEFEVLTIDEVQRKDLAARKALLNEADIAVLCLPDDAARESVALIDNDTTKVLDASSAHRVAKGWVYGMAELDGGAQAALIKSARFVANPGCYSTGFVMTIRPLVQAGIIGPDHALSINAVSGYSGGGRQMMETYEAEAAIRAQGYRPYGLDLAHKHLPEMKAYGCLNYDPLFSPAVTAFAQGMVVSIPLLTRTLKKTVNANDIQACLSAAYENSQYVTVAPVMDAQRAKGFPIDAQALNGTNQLLINVIGNADQVLLMAQLDNLGKGASLAAVQNLQLMSGK